MLGVEAAALGANLVDGRGRRVVDEDGGVGQQVGGFQQNGPLVIMHLAETQAMAVDAGFHGEEPLHELLVAHLQAEDADARAVALGSVLRHVERQARLAHGRPRRQDDEVALLQPAQQSVEKGEAGGHAHERVLIARQKVDVVDHVAHDGADGHEVAVDERFAHAEDQRLGLVDNRVDLLAVVVGDLGDLPRRRNQPPAQRRPLDDVRVMVDIHGRGRAADEVGDIRRPAHFLQAIAALQFVDDRHVVERFVALVQGQHRLVEPGVALAEEILGAQKVGDLDDRVRVDQQRAEHGALGFKIGGNSLDRCVGRFHHLHKLWIPCG